MHSTTCVCFLRFFPFNRRTSCQKNRGLFDSLATLHARLVSLLGTSLKLDNAMCRQERKRKQTANAPQPPLPLLSPSGRDDDDHNSRTPTRSKISYLTVPTTCPPAPRKPPLLLMCKKQHQRRPPAESSSVPPINLRLDELEHLFRPRPAPTNADEHSAA